MSGRKMRWLMPPRFQHARSLTKKPIIWRSTLGDFLGFAGWRMSLQLRDYEDGPR